MTPGVRRSRWGLASGRLRLAAPRSIQFALKVGQSGSCVAAKVAASLLIALAAAFANVAASAADLSSLGIESADNPMPAPVIEPGPNTYINFLDEVRVGVYAHNWIHDENSPVDVSGELLSSPIGYANNIGGQWFSWFFNPRINIGAMINTGGKTSYGFTGLTWRIPIYKAFFFEGEFGGAVNTSPLRDEPGRVNTGCRFDFRESGGFGYQFTEHWVLVANVEHISHASLCTHINPGLTQVGARIGYKF
jgi:lipid A 3-O-deacylase